MPYKINSCGRALPAMLYSYMPQRDTNLSSFERRIASLRIVLIGPVYPYKGGIAHYTGMMCKSLRKRYDVHMISYNMQYPRLLLKREQKDYQNDSMRIDDANYAIHTANPFNWPSVARASQRTSSRSCYHPMVAPVFCALLPQYSQTSEEHACTVCVP